MLKILSARIALALGLAGTVAVPAVALAHGGGDKGAMIQKYDKNGDGKLDDAERAALKADFQKLRETRRKEMLAKYDADKDGKLSETERQAAQRDREEGRFRELDTNKDGVLSFDEFAAGKREMGRGFGHRHARFGGMFRGPRKDAK